ncbi:alpha/beta fold hydrolase [Myxococcus sp. RHSTA-1-4]|uniref:alpha/beta fold hydrolase n=1 Tax=Myxococcus sp. RHSTA-1-4 TaxID=2874601 RepID=UPI001CBE4291|nr:alpha/beta fold hydrolase [Myxococcus sp. RHSTA-1-4]
MLGAMAHSSSVSVTQHAPGATVPAAAASRRGGWSAFALGLVVAPVALLLLVAAARIGASPSGWGYAVGLSLVGAGLLSRPWRRRRGLTRAGLGLVLCVAAARLVLADGTLLETPRLPDGGHRWVNRIVAERDGTLLAAHALVLSGGVPRSDARDFIPALEAAFDRMDAAEGALATPAVATYLGLQSPKSFDTLVIPPPGSATPETAIVFLHGHAGNFAVYCWQMARAAQAISALTVCPSVGPAGDWWSSRGERTLEATLDWLASRGVRRVYLGGLSNGGAGASVLVSRVSHPRLELRGLVLVSGAISQAPAPSVPTLLVQGRHDSMMPTRSMRAFAERLGRSATYVELDSGHFAFLDRHAECERAIATWLRERERE